MNIQVVTAICAAVTPALLLGGGFWLRHLVNQQLKAKDATIEKLQAAHTVYEARIASLESQRAPELAKDYRVMLEHAEQMAKEKRQLAEQIKSLTDEQKESENAKAILAMMNQIDGLYVAADVLTRAVTGQSNDVVSWSKFTEKITGSAFVPSPTTQDLTLSILKMRGQLQAEIDSRQLTMRHALNALAHR